MNACGEPAVNDARIITPALTHAWIPWGIEETRATIEPSPFIVR